MRRLFAAFLLSAAATAALASPSASYDEAADARADIQATLAAAQQEKRPVLLVFGANWCGDCKMLDQSFKEGAAAPLIAKHFKVVKIDVGRFVKNVDIAEQYGVTLKKGIPAVAVLSTQGKPVYVTNGGELSSARKLGDQGIYEFFSKVVAGS
ncbi:thioredoxin family protein [Roseateles sp. DAIF2]|uniref:thioredoxin family protein n=1 Tax=Roseateles sp. DAIF2 TaxID=2714952 RepID=UPI0018A2F050|nr:thioredoxin family protein [Roseateles sp. DAIF2]QPF72057.1 thioredoxin family protein [Roseateles sp. DAIF2]